MTPLLKNSDKHMQAIEAWGKFWQSELMTYRVPVLTDDVDTNHLDVECPRVLGEALENELAPFPREFVNPRLCRSCAKALKDVTSTGLRLCAMREQFDAVLEGMEGFHPLLVLYAAKALQHSMYTSQTDAIAEEIRESVRTCETWMRNIIWGILKDIDLGPTPWNNAGEEIFLFNFDLRELPRGLIDSLNKSGNFAVWMSRVKVMQVDEHIVISTPRESLEYMCLSEEYAVRLDAVPSEELLKMAQTFHSDGLSWPDSYRAAVVLT